MDVRGVSADVVYEMADGDGLQWVWNFAVNPKGKIRCLRFLAREVIAPETTRNLRLDEVLALILGDRKNFHAGEACQLLRVRRPTLGKLRDQLAGKLRSGGAFIPSSGLRDFLRNRWLGRAALSRCQFHKTPATALPATIQRPGRGKSLLPPREARQLDFRRRSNP